DRAANRRKFLAGLGVALCGTAAAETDRPPPAAEAGLAGIKQLLAGKRPLTWVFTGDSITHGALHTLGWRSYPEHFAERVRWEQRRMRHVGIHTGIRCDTTHGMGA